MADSTVKVVFLGDSKDLKRALDDVDSATDKASSRFEGFGKKAALGFGAGGVAVGAAFIKFGQMGIALDTMGKKTATVFEGSTDDVKAWADQNAKSFGLTDDKLENLAAGFGDLLKPMGFTADQAAKMSKETVGLSGALSAWSGGTKSAAEVSDILAKAMLGERDGLKALGISISDADVQQRLAAKGQKDLTGAALEQAKALATQELIFEKSTDAQKAWADGSMDAVKSQNEMKSKLGELQETLATKLAPAFAATVDFLLTRVIPAFESMAAWIEQHWPRIQETISNVMTRIREVIETVLGVIQRFWDNWGQQIMTVVDGVFTQIRGIIEGALKIIQGVINVVMGLIHGDWSRVWDGIRGILDGVWTAIRGTVEGALEILRGVVDAGMKLVAGVFDAAWDAIVDFFSELPGRITGALGDVGRFIWDAISAGMDALGEFILAVVDKVVDWFKNLPGRVVEGLGNIGEFVWDAIKAGWEFFDEQVDKLVAKVVDYFIKLPGRIAEIGGELLSVGEGLVERLWDGLKNVVGKMADFGQAILDRVLALPGEVGHHAWMLGASIVENFWNAAKEIGSRMVTFGLDIINALIALPGALASWAFDVGKSIVDAIVQGILSAPGAIRSALDSLIPRSIGIGPIDIGIPGRASGGPASGLTLVGEQGPELAYFGGGGHVFNNSDTRRMLSGGGGSPIVVNIYNPKVSSPGDINLMANQVSRELAVALRGSVN